MANLAVLCMCASVRACMRACVRVCVYVGRWRGIHYTVCSDACSGVCVWGGGRGVGGVGGGGCSVNYGETAQPIEGYWSQGQIFIGTDSLRIYM